MGPCGTSDDCRDFDFAFRDDGIFAHTRQKVELGGEITYFYHVDCGDFGEADARDLKVTLGQNAGVRTIVYLDVFCVS